MLITDKVRATLIRYLTMKVFVLDWMGGDPVTSLAMGAEFREHNNLPPSFSINMFNCYEGSWRLAYREHFLTLSEIHNFVSVDQPSNTKSFAIGFGNLYVFAYTSTSVSFRPSFGERFAVSLVPHTPGIGHWPPPFPIDSDEAEFIAQTLMRIGEAADDGVKLLRL